MNGIYPSGSRAVICQGKIIGGFAEGGFGEFSAKVEVS